MSDSKNLDNILEAVKASEAELKEALGRQAEELKSARETTAATAAEIKTAGERYEAALVEFKGAREKLDADNAAIAARVVELEKAAKRFSFSPEDPEQKSVGERFVTEIKASGEVERLRSGGRASSTVYVGNFDRKTSVAGVTTASAYAPAQRAGLVNYPLRPLRLLDLFARVPTASNAIEYVEVQGLGPATTASVSSIAIAAGGVATLTAAAAHGLQVGDVIEVSGAASDASLGDLNGAHVISEVTSGTVVKFKTTGSGTITGTIKYRNLSGFGAATAVAEANDKPEAGLKFELRTANVRTVAHWLPASRQVLDDLPQLQALIDNNLTHGVNMALERQLLYGNGSSPQLQGIMGHPLVTSYKSASTVTKLLALRTAITLASLSNLEPNGIVCNPLDWEQVETSQGTDGHFVWSIVNGPMNPIVWRLPVAVTKAIDVGGALVGNFALGATLYDREQASVRFSEHHDTYFIHNMLAILAEARVAVAWQQPQAFVNLDYSDSAASPAA